MRRTVSEEAKRQMDVVERGHRADLELSVVSISIEPRPFSVDTNHRNSGGEARDRDTHCDRLVCPLPTAT